jgi:hypothetical protein
MTNELIKTVKRYGKSLVVYLPAKDALSLGLKEGDHVLITPVRFHRAGESVGLDVGEEKEDKYGSAGNAPTCRR